MWLMSTTGQTGNAGSPLRLVPSDSLLLCVDVQERLCQAMPKDALARLVSQASVLLHGAKQLGVPVVVSEQYRRGLGPTVPQLAAVWPEGTPVLDKLEFSAWASPSLSQAIAASGRKQIVVFGMETHICVYQTVRDLASAGYAVHVPQDAVCSRDPDNARAGLALAERAGGVVTTTETVLFDWLFRAGTPAFKAVSALVK